MPLIDNNLVVTTKVLEPVDEYLLFGSGLSGTPTGARATVIVNGTSHSVSITKDSTTRWKVLFSSVSQYITDTKGSGRLFLEVLNGSSVIASGYVEVINGYMPASFYDNGQEVGAVFGRRAEDGDANKFVIYKNLTPEIPLGGLIRVHKINKSTGSVSKSSTKTITETYSADYGWMPLEIINRDSTSGTNRGDLEYYAQSISAVKVGELYNTTVSVSVKNNNTTSSSSAEMVLSILEIYVGG